MRLSQARLFPLILLSTLAGLTFWLEHTVRDEYVHPSLRRHDPDYVVEQFTISNYTAEQGTLESTLSARKMLHYPDDDSSDLLQPRLVQTKTDHPRMTLTADRGALSQDGADTFLYDNVYMHREPAPELAEMHLTTSVLHIVRDRSIIRTDQDVEMREETRQMTGRGMEYHSETEQLFLRDNVRGTFAPKKAR